MILLVREMGFKKSGHFSVHWEIEGIFFFAYICALIGYENAFKVSWHVLWKAHKNITFLTLQSVQCTE